MEEDFILGVYKDIINYTNLNPLLIYDMTIYELDILFKEKLKKIKSDFEAKANIIRIAISSAMNGKKIDLFEKEERVIKRSKGDGKRELKALDDLGL